MLFDLFLLLPFQFRRVLQKVFHRMKLFDERLGCFLPNARNARNVIRGITHQAKDIDDLSRLLDLPAGADFRHPQDFDRCAGIARLVDQCLRPHELTKILVGSHHEGGGPQLTLGPPGQGANDIIGLVAVLTEHGDVKGLAQSLNDGNSHDQILRHFLTLSFVRWVLNVPRRRRRSIKHNSQMSRLPTF